MRPELRQRVRLSTIIEVVKGRKQILDWRLSQKRRSVDDRMRCRKQACKPQPYQNTPASNQPRSSSGHCASSTAYSRRSKTHSHTTSSASSLARAPTPFYRAHRHDQSPSRPPCTHGSRSLYTRGNAELPRSFNDLHPCLNTPPPMPCH